MKTIRQRTFIAITTLFAVSVAFLWAGASPKLTGEIGRAFAAAPGQPAALPEGLFQAPWRGYDTGIFGEGFGPASFAMGDLDGDGDTDILVGDTFFSSTGVSVLKNNGDQTFAAPVYYPLPQNQTVGEVALSDFDLDGDLDAFATVRGNFDQLLKIMVWRNNGNGTYIAPIEFATGAGPADIVVADFTGDGKPDVITANFGASSISFLRHNGLSGNAAGFLAPVNFSTTNRAEKIAAADVNGDGILDVVVGTLGPPSARLAVMINTGNGNFAAPVFYEAAPGAFFGSTAVALADLDNDGDIDLIGGGVYENGSIVNGAATIRRNNGTGTFGSAEIILFLDPNFISQPKELSVGFINGDGFRDIIAAVPSGRAVEGFVVVNSNGSGGFNTPVYYEASQQTFDVAVVDLDNDGDGDVITVANSSAAVTVHENPGNGLFRVLTRYEVASLSDAVESADIDNDGDIDIVVNGEFDIASNDPLLKILKNNGNGTFAPAIDYTPARNFADMKLRDINGDGFVDMIFAPDGGFPPYHFGTALNNGNGTFAPTVVTNVFSCGEGTIEAADLDGDGDRDIVLTEEETCIGSEAHIFIFRNDGNQNFFRMPDIALPGLLPHGLSLADVTGDGDIDIITALSTGMGVFPGNGNLTFGGPIISTTRPYKFKMADFNQDGLFDVGMIMQQDSFGTDTIATALGNGNGTFQAIRTQTGSSVLETLRISDDLEPGDLDGDGRLDLLVFNYASNDVSVFIVNPDGSLQPHRRYGIGNTPQLGTLADLDGDGRIDIAAAIGLPPSGLHNAVVVLRNAGPPGPTPTPSPTPTATATPTSTPSPTPTSTPIPTPTPTVTPNPTPTPTATPAPTATPSPTPSATPTVTPTATPTPTVTPTPTPPVAARYDFNHDGKPDFVLYNGSTRRTAIWYMNNNVQIGGAFGPILPAGWNLIDVADFNRDGNNDYALFNSSTRQTAIWYLSGNMLTGGAWGPILPSGWTLVATGDFNGDGRPDFVLYNPTTRRTALWYLNNNVFIGGAFGPTLPGWRLAGVADFNGNGQTDYALFNPGTRQSGIYYLAGPIYVSGAFGPTIASGYDLMGTADFNGGGKPDYVLYNATTRRTAFYYLNNNIYVSSALGPVLPAGWSLAAP